MKIGAHVSTAGGISNAIAKGQEIACEVIQVFGRLLEDGRLKRYPETRLNFLNKAQ